jgi:hypothetical protein
MQTVIPLIKAVKIDLARANRPPAEGVVRLLNPAVQQGGLPPFLFKEVKWLQ